MGNKAREIALADRPLLAIFRELVAGKRNWPLYLCGRPGTGKTCAALALLDHVQHGLYDTAAGLTDKALSVFHKGPGINWEYARPDKCQLFVLDELGCREKVGDTHYETVQKLIDVREGYPLVLISNLDLKTLARVYDARIASRAGSGTPVELQGRDRRAD